MHSIAGHLGWNFHEIDGANTNKVARFFIQLQRVSTARLGQTLGGTKFSLTFISKFRVDSRSTLSIAN